jgi:hypothetical protein
MDLWAYEHLVPHMADSVTLPFYRFRTAYHTIFLVKTYLESSRKLKIWYLLVENK